MRIPLARSSRIRRKNQSDPVRNDARKAIGGLCNSANKDRPEAVRSQREEVAVSGRVAALAALVRASGVCADSGQNFRFSPKCLTDLAPIARDKRDHENLDR